MHSKFQKDEYLVYYVTDPQARGYHQEIAHLVRYQEEIPDWSGPGYQLKEGWHKVIGFDDASQGRFPITCTDSELMRLDPSEQLKAAQKFKEAQEDYKPPRQGIWGEIFCCAFLILLWLSGVAVGAFIV